MKPDALNCAYIDKGGINDMTEANILDLYWRRSESAIDETDSKYGKYCFTVANNILDDAEDSEESVNDTYLETWNSIPPQRPQSLKAYLGKLCRHISISRFRRRSAAKRGGGEVALVIDELGDCVPASNNVHMTVEAMELAAYLNCFLDALPEREQRLFVARYWYAMPVNKIAERFGIKENTAKTILLRTRRKLQAALEREGY